MKVKGVHQHQFTNYKEGQISIGSFQTESGEVIENAQLAYEQVGSPHLPVILVCHALTGNQYSVGTEEEPGWWSGLIGPGKSIDTNQWQVITFNVLGGCNGSSGPTSINPINNVEYRMDFPTITIRDMVHAQRKALHALDVQTLKAVIGGSLGGMQALEWGLLYPDDMEQLYVLAATPYLSDYGIAFNQIGISAIVNDPAWDQGRYVYSNKVKGLEIARMAGMVTYRSPILYNDRFNRQTQRSPDMETLFSVESYLKYQGEKFTKRFDVNSYLYLLRAMNNHDIGRDRTHFKEAAKQFKAKFIGIAYEHDLLYPKELMEPFIEEIANSHFYFVETNFGHDGFLVEFEKWGRVIQHHLENRFTLLKKEEPLA